MKQTQLTDHDTRTYPKITDEGFVEIHASEQLGMKDMHTVVAENDEAVLLECLQSDELNILADDMNMEFHDLRSKMRDAADEFDESVSDFCWVIVLAKKDNETMFESDYEERKTIQNLVHEQLRTRTLRQPSSPVVPVVRRDPGKTAPFALEGEQVALIDYSDNEWEVFLIEADENGDWEHPRCEPDATFENRKAAVEHAAEALKTVADN